MTGVEIKYNNTTIASLNDAGTEILETNGKVCADDITVEYKKDPEFIADGTTRIYIDLFSEKYLSPYLCFSINGSASIDWGDGSEATTVTGTSTTTNYRKYTQHVYSTTGKYTITITVTGSLYFHGGTAGGYALVMSSTELGAQSTPYRRAVQKIEFGNNTNCGINAFRYFVELQSVYVHDPASVFDASTFYNCTGLVKIVMPSSSTASFGTYAFYGATLREIQFWSLTTVPGNLLRNCSHLLNVVFSNTIQTIEAEALRNCSSLCEIHFKSSSPPTVTNSNAWDSLFSGCKIYVPTGTLSSYTSATNYPDPNTYTYIEE